MDQDQPSDPTQRFEQERPRLLRLATGILGDHAEAEDAVQTAWIRLHGTHADDIRNLPGWLTTVTTRLCLDRLRARTPVPTERVEPGGTALDPADHVELADTVSLALQVVLDRLTPTERVAFVLRDTFDLDYPTIAAVLDRSEVAVRKLASRARTKVARPVTEPRQADAAVVDAFLAAARAGDLTRLLQLLAPDACTVGDAAAVALGTPARTEGREAVAAMFAGAAKAALPTYVGDRPGAAWVHRGETRVAFDFTVEAGLVHRIDFRADPEVLARVVRRAG